MRRTRILLAIALALATGAQPALARPDAADAPPSLRQLAKGIVRTGVPGALILASDATGTRFASAGYANVATKERLTPADAFRVGSITKTFVATVVLQLAGEGVLGLDDPVERWLPGVVPNGGAITLRQLLDHTSGIYNYTDDADLLAALRANLLRTFTPQELVGIATARAPLFPPGQGWSYSNTNYVLLGLVVEAATHASIGDQLRGRIFEPLGLAHTSFATGPDLPAPYAHGYLLPGNDLLPTAKRRDVSRWNPSLAWAAGAIVSTAPDLARFYGALLGGKLLAPALLGEMERLVPIDGGGYGLGLAELDTRCGQAWGHDGSVPGFLAFVLESKDGRLEIVAMANASIGSRAQGSAIEIALESAFCR